MSKNIYKIISESSLSDNDKYYWGYQYRLGIESLVPYLIEKGVFKSKGKVCEIGSAEGGALHALVEFGAEYGLGTDISEGRIKVGAQISHIAELNVEYHYHNILTEPLLPEWENAFDFVLLRDVIEHLDDTELALKNINKLIKPGGFLFLTFPPYNSPYGGHQHTLAGNWLTKLPYIHLLPTAIFKSLIKSGRSNDIWEVMRLRDIRLNPDKVRKAANNSGMNIYNEDYYLLRPVFKMKFGLPAIKITSIAKLPFVRNFFALEAAMILQKPS